VTDPNDREAMLDLVAAAALGVLPQRDQALVAAYILSDPAARAEYDGLRPAADLIGLAAEQAPDARRGAAMKAAVMDVVRAAPQPLAAPVRTPRQRRNALWTSVLAAAAALVFGLTTAVQNVALRGDLADAQRRASALEQQVVAERDTVRRDRRILADLAARDSTRYTNAYGEIIVRGSRMYLALGALPPLPRGRVYQAWTLPRGAKDVVPSVTFTPATDGPTLVPLPEDATRTAAIAHSVEPLGGSRAPTSKPTFIQPLT
jgi:hypothetical protein